MAGAFIEQLARVEARVSELPDRLRAHIERARVVGRELSELFGADVDGVVIVPSKCRVSDTIRLPRVILRVGSGIYRFRSTLPAPE